MCRHKHTVCQTQSWSTPLQSWSLCRWTPYSLLWLLPSRCRLRTRSCRRPPDRSRSLVFSWLHRYRKLCYWWFQRCQFHQRYKFVGWESNCNTSNLEGNCWWSFLYHLWHTIHRHFQCASLSDSSHSSLFLCNSQASLGHNSFRRCRHRVSVPKHRIHGNSCEANRSTHLNCRQRQERGWKGHRR